MTDYAGMLRTEADYFEQVRGPMGPGRLALQLRMAATAFDEQAAEITRLRAENNTLRQSVVECSGRCHIAALEKGIKGW